MQDTKLALIPEPEKIVYLDGFVSETAQVEESCCAELGEETYQIHAEGDSVRLIGGSERALKYARRTWEQILFQCKDEIPAVKIEDKPEFEYRAFHIDCARHYFSVEELKKMIEMAAYFKLNRFHWHFSDDQGWRIESKKFPGLHRIGAVRKGDHFGQFCSNEENSDYYTQEDVEELVMYCQELGVEIVPEIDMPGHVTAILAAYPELSCTGNSVEVGTKAGIYTDILCPGKETMFQFVEELLDEMLEMFPGKYFHIGGDEAPKERWETCPLCKARMEKECLDSLQELQGYLTNRIADYLRKRNRIAIVWNEAAYGKNLDNDIVIQYWTEDKEQAIQKHLKNGGKMIVSNMRNSYCDYPYGSVTLESLYSLDVFPAGMEKNCVIGTECLIWTEYIRENPKLEMLSWPRFTASAEVGWCGNRRPGYESFANRLEILFPVFQEKEICATEKSGWVPDEETKKKQSQEFLKNFPPEIMAAFRKAQEKI